MAKRAAAQTLPLPAETRPRDAVLEKAVGEITKKYGDGAVMRLGEATHLVVEAIPTGSLSLDLALGVGGIPRGRVTEVFGPEVVGQDDAVPAHRRRSAAPGRGVRLHRHGACAGPGVCGEVRGGRREPVHLAAGHGGAGAGDRRDAGAVGCGGRGGDRQRGGAGAAGGDRRGDGGRHDGDAGAADEPGAAEAEWGDQADEHGGGVHQPAAAEDRGDVWEPGDDDGGDGAEVLCVGDGWTCGGSRASRWGRKWWGAGRGCGW